MATKTYTVASEEGSTFVTRFDAYDLPVEVGEEVELDLGSTYAERAVLAAGWLAEAKKKGGR